LKSIIVLLRKILLRQGGKQQAVIQRTHSDALESIARVCQGPQQHRPEMVHDSGALQLSAAVDDAMAAVIARKTECYRRLLQLCNL
jgi:hypothetical protein